MKKSIYLIISLIILSIGCKKYPEDEMISTYSALGRLTVGSEWQCVKYQNEDGKIFNIPKGHFFFKLEYNQAIYTAKLNYYNNKYNIINSSLNFVDTVQTKWQLKDNNNILSIDGQGEFIIKKLAINELKLVSNKSTVYWFVKKPIDKNIKYVTNFSGVPFFNLFDGKILESSLMNKDCEQINQFIEAKYKFMAGSNLITSDLLTNMNGVKGFGIGAINNTGYIREAYVNFHISNFDRKAKYLSFYIKAKLSSYIYKEYSSEIKNKILINNSPVLSENVSVIYSNSIPSNWGLVVVKLDNEIHLITVEIKESSDFNNFYEFAIDEINVWE